MSSIPFQTPQSAANEFSQMQFIFTRLLNRTCTTQLVVVKAVRNAGGVTPVGTVDVQPMVHQINGDGQVTPHAVIYGVPYMRLQGGANAIILDPQVGDIGVAVFAMRDISVVKASKAPGAPGSGRTYDYADGLYFGGFLNGTPEQYIRYFTGGIELISPTKIRLQAPTVEIDASSEFTVQSPQSEFSGTIHTPETITGDTDVIADGTSGHTHVHGGITPGGSNTAPPV